MAPWPIIPQNSNYYYPNYNYNHPNYNRNMIQHQQNPWQTNPQGMNRQMQAQRPMPPFGTNPSASPWGSNPQIPQFGGSQQMPQFGHSPQRQAPPSNTNPQKQIPQSDKGQQMAMPQFGGSSHGQMPQPSGTQNQQPPQWGMNQMPPKNLPDGVTFQPLDENALNELRKISLSPHEPATPKTPIIDQEEKVESIFSTKLENLMQHERNASLFYENLAKKALSKQHKNILNEIGKCCEDRRETYNKIYHKHKGEEYKPLESDVDIYISFNEGVSLAIFEESKALRELGELYENFPDQQRGHIINALVYKKISDLSYLHLLRAYPQ